MALDAGVPAIVKHEGKIIYIDIEEDYFIGE
jgi:hypothetical protein